MKKVLKSKTARAVIIETILRILFIVFVDQLTKIYISEPVKRFTIFTIAVLLYTAIDAILFRKLFKNESEEYLGWQMMWMYPYNQIIIAATILTICFIGLFVFIRKTGNVSEESIIIGITTGVIASSVIVLLSEMSNNHRNNLKRFAVLNDYFSVVHFYKDDIDLNKKIVEQKVSTEKVELIDCEIVLNTMREDFDSKKLIASYSAVDLQAIAWEIVDYWQLLKDTLCNHSELLYIHEIKCLNNINSCINSIKSEIISSKKMRDIEAETKHFKDEDDTSKYTADIHRQEIESYLHNIAKEKNETILASIVVLIVYFDQNMKLLNQYVLYLDDKEYKHFIHMTDKLERTIMRMD